MSRESASSPGVVALRFGIMCRSTQFEAWQTECLEHLSTVPSVELAALILERVANSAVGTRRSTRMASPGLGFRLWQRVLGRPAARRQVDLSTSLRSLPPVSCAVSVGPDGRSHVAEADARALRELRLDFVLRFSPDACPAELAEAARYGIWAFHHGDLAKSRDGPPCFWEAYHGTTVTAAALLRLTGREDSAVVLRRGYLRTKRYSYARNANQVLSRTTHWPAQVCVDLRNGAAGYLEGPAEPVGPAGFRAPSNWEMLRFLARAWRAACREFSQLLFRHEQWNVGIVKAPIATFLSPGHGHQVEWLPAPPRGEFLADPFGLSRDGKVTILCERLIFREGRGVIASLGSCRPGSSPAPVSIGPPVHRSYPFLIEWEGDIYCIPETAEAHEVGLYRAQEFPSLWTKVATLIRNVAALDSTVFRHGERWWLACVDLERGAPADLFLWFAPALWGPWTPHPGNPVKTDVRSSRPAGTPFEHEGMLYRPAQDCSAVYGGRVVINRVTCLTPTAFAEEPAAVVEPNPSGPFPAGLHTLSGVGGVTLIDGKRTAFNPTEFRLALRNILQALPGSSRRRTKVLGCW